MPESVRAYTAEYRAENDSIGEWLDACGSRSPSAETTTAALRASYQAWAEANGEKTVSSKALGDALRARGFERVKVGSARGWRGLALREDR